MAAETPSLDTIFCAAVEMASAEDRAAYIAQACGDDLDLRSQVDKLVNAHFRAGRFLEKPAVGPLASGEQASVSAETTVAPAPLEGPGMHIGPYKLLQQIGEGGMGTVFMAEQAQPVQRKVALKVIKPGMDSAQVIARFSAERQALALMNHQNIARVLDVGATDSGRPYFVMELVKGVPITKFCDEQHLTPRERLELFIPVCQAIQHAHQKGIIHRDIKPSNVLVTLYDGKPVPKVIDFGVAKAIEQRLTERTLFTQFGQVVGTLEYMSPEQAEPSALDVDTRSDIYSLGVLLYELLTGSTPLERKKLREAGFVEMLRMIREEEPPKPSTRLSDSGEKLPSISAQRKMEPAKLTKLVRGELDWIVMKSLEKDRNGRYETANGFARDIQRYLSDEPVEACPPSTAYRLRKFARKNRKLLATSSAFALLLALILGASSLLIWQEKMRAELAYERASHNLEDALQVLDEMYIDIVSKRLPKNTNLTVDDKETLQKALVFYEQFVERNRTDPNAGQQMAKAYLRVCEIYNLFHDHMKAEQVGRRALALYETLAAASPSNQDYTVGLMKSRQRLGAALYNQRPRQASQAFVLFQQILDSGGALPPNAPVLIETKEVMAECYSCLGTISRDRGNPKSAEEFWRKSLNISQQLAEQFPKFEFRTF